MKKIFIINLFPKKDQCDKCCQYKVKHLSEEEYQKHILKKKLGKR